MDVLARRAQPVGRAFDGGLLSPGAAGRDIAWPGSNTSMTDEGRRHL